MEGVMVAIGDYPLGDESYTVMEATDRQAIVDLLEKIKSLKGEDGYFEITMPCGYERKFKSNSDIPFEDLPCPCGNYGRYLIEFKRRR